MSGLDLSIPQEAIMAFVRQEFPNYVVYDNSMLDDEFVLKIGNKVKPYIVLGFGGIYPNSRGGSFAGPRFDEYTSTIDATVVAAKPEHARKGMNLVVDKLVGYKPTGASPMTLQGGAAMWGVPDVNGVPHVYLASQRLTYAVNSSNPGAYITP